MEEQFTFFWDGPFSQWCRSVFTIDDITYNCAEQYMMAKKAHLFGDHNAVVAILSTSDPEEQKRLGRGVVGYTDARWQQTQSNGQPLCWNVVYDGTMAKFSQHKGLRGELLKTVGTTIVEASPEDPIWGIGLRKSDPRAQHRQFWLGKNWLGEILTVVRDTIIDRTPDQLAAMIVKTQDDR